MADKPVDGKFSLSYLLFGGGLSDWLRPFGDDARRVAVYGIIALVCIGLWVWIGPKKKPSGPINQPRHEQSVVVTPFAKVETIKLESKSENRQELPPCEKNWEVGIFGGGIYFDGKPGAFGGGELKRRF